MVFSGLHMLTNNLKYVIWMLAGRYHGLIAQNKHANETGPGIDRKDWNPKMAMCSQIINEYAWLLCIYITILK